MSGNSNRNLYFFPIFFIHEEFEKILIYNDKGIYDLYIYCKFTMQHEDSDAINS